MLSYDRSTSVNGNLPDYISENDSCQLVFRRAYMDLNVPHSKVCSDIRVKHIITVIKRIVKQFAT